MPFNYTVSICRVEIIIVENWCLPDSFVPVPTEIRKITQVCGSNATRPLSQHKIMLMKTLQYGERCVFAQPFLNYFASFHWFWAKFTGVHRVYCHFAGPWRMKFYYSVSFFRVKGNGYGHLASTCIKASQQFQQLCEAWPLGWCWTQAIRRFQSEMKILDAFPHHDTTITRFWHLFSLSPHAMNFTRKSFKRVTVRSNFVRKNKAAWR